MISFLRLKVCSKQTNAMQKIFLARSEVEFFRSEVSFVHDSFKI